MACKRSLILRDTSTKWVPREPDRYWTLGKEGKGCLYHEDQKLYEYIQRKKNPFWRLKQLSKYWESPSNLNNDFWEAPKHLFWICRDKAYTNLPGDWAGSCTIGIIKPAFSLLPKESGSTLGVPIYDDLKKNNCEKRKVTEMKSTQERKEKIWSPEEIIKTYGPATWAQDGPWGYRTPIYMLNRIIRLQAVHTIIFNQTALALDHISN